MTSVMPIAWSSTTLARWYVGRPSDLTSTASSTVSVSKATSPRMRSANATVRPGSTFRRTTWGSPAATRRAVSSAASVRAFVICPRVAAE